jgi:hypothetical protein
LPDGFGFITAAMAFAGLYASVILIDGEIQGARVDDAHVALADEPVEPLPTWTGLRVLVGPFSNTAMMPG